MKSPLKSVVIAAAGLFAFAALSSCSEEAKQERAAESAAETAVAVTEDYCKLLESIKDKESAQKAIEKMDGIADKYAKIAEKSKAAGTTPPDAATIEKTTAQMKPLGERMAKAAAAAMPIIAADPELSKAFAEKQTLLQQKMVEAAK